MVNSALDIGTKVCMTYILSSKGDKEMQSKGSFKPIHEYKMLYMYM